MAQPPGRPPTLSRTAIIAAATELIDSDAPPVSMRAIGSALGVDPSAIYRYFTSKDQLLRAVVDASLDDVVLPDLAAGPWRETVEAACIGLRRALLRAPKLAASIQLAPPRLNNELRLTEAILAALQQAGLSDHAAVTGYHSLMELTVGSATVDASMTAWSRRQREAAYRQWRKDYAALEPESYPASVASAHLLYLGNADSRFADALDLLLDGIAP